MIKAILTSCLFLSIFTICKADNILERDASGLIHANLQNETLAEVRTFFEKNYNITFIGDAKLYETQVTLSFDGLSLEKALRKIFAKTNVAFKYNNRGKITEARLLPTSTVKNTPVLANTFMNISGQTPADDQQDTIVQPPELTEPTETNSEPTDESIRVDSGSESPNDALQAEPNSGPPDESTDTTPNDETSGN